MTTSRAVLITGCSSGIGRATALRLHQAGFPVYATARRPETLADLATAGIATLALDVTDEASMVAAVKRVEADHGAVGVLVNNAGYGLQGPVEEVPLTDARRQFETNVFGPVRLSQLVLPGMRAQRWGRVINISSMGGRFTFPGGGFYHASKHALGSLSDAMRLELASFGVRVVIIEPGPVTSEFGDTAVGTIEPSEGRRPGPYDEFRRALAARYAKAYDGSRASLASPPETVAAVIERAARSARPRPRYVVGLAAKGLVGLRRVLPDRAFDLVMRSQFPTP
jgi:NAD(P)-dependent dehydrogenase (short-subunit alcohol dehydrogenase family)